MLVLVQFFSLIIPLKKKSIYIILVILEILNSWGALEVYFISLVASLFQIKQFIQFMLHGGCDIINIMLQSYSGLMIEGDSKCFDVESVLMFGTL